MLRGLRKKLQPFEILPNSDEILLENQQNIRENLVHVFCKKGQLGSKKWVTETLLQSYGNDIPKWMRRSLRKVTFSPTFGIFRLYHENKLHHQNPKGYNCGGTAVAGKIRRLVKKMTLQSDRRIHPEIHFLIDYDKVSVTHFCRPKLDKLRTKIFILSENINDFPKGSVLNLAKFQMVVTFFVNVAA